MRAPAVLEDCVITLSAADVSKTFRQVTLVFLGTGTMVVCLKHLGITDSDREKLKMSVKTLSSW